MPYYQVWVTVPLADWSESENATALGGFPAPVDGDGEGLVPAAAGSSSSSWSWSSSWSRWNKLRLLSEHSQALFVALEVG